MSSTIEDVLRLARPELLTLVAYEHARWDPRFERLHANESPWAPAGALAGDLHRYPEPQPAELTEALAQRYNVRSDQLLVGRGSDEGIDLLTRAFCASGRSTVIVCPPTFGMYAVAARIQGAQVAEAPLDQHFQPDLSKIERALDASARIVWLCSPNNPTGNLVERNRIDELISMTAGRSLLVIDEAYGEFAPQASLIPELGRVPHLVILRTMSKAAALAGARVGTVIAHPRLIALLRKLIPPYALPAPSIVAALDCLTPAAIAIERERIAQLIAERDRLARALGDLASRSALVRRIWSSDANFLLVEFEDRARAFTRLSAAGLLVRDVGGRAGLGEVLRITVGTRAQNDRVIAHLAGDARDP